MQEFLQIYLKSLLLITNLDYLQKCSIEVYLKASSLENHKVLRKMIYRLPYPSSSKDPHFNLHPCHFDQIRKEILKMIEIFRTVDLPFRKRAFLLEKPQRLAESMKEGYTICHFCYIIHYTPIVLAYGFIAGTRIRFQKDQQLQLIPITERSINNVSNFVNQQIGDLTSACDLSESQIE